MRRRRQRRRRRRSSYLYVVRLETAGRLCDYVLVVMGLQGATHEEKPGQRRPREIESRAQMLTGLLKCCAHLPVRRREIKLFHGGNRRNTDFFSHFFKIIFV